MTLSLLCRVVAGAPFPFIHATLVVRIFALELLPRAAVAWSKLQCPPASVTGVQACGGGDSGGGGGGSGGGSSSGSVGGGGGGGGSGGGDIIKSDRVG